MAAFEWIHKLLYDGSGSMRWEISLHASDRLLERFPDLGRDVETSMDNAHPFGWQKGNCDVFYLDDSHGIVYVVSRETQCIRTVLTKEQAIANMQMYIPHQSIVKQAKRAVDSYVAKKIADKQQRRKRGK